MIKNLIDGDDQPNSEEPPQDRGSRSTADVLGILDADRGAPDAANAEPTVLQNSPPESFAETARKSGLAWSAGIAFFASVVFMLAIGWLADIFLGISPWGIVAGVVLGSLIGFVQFFRITSQIFKK